MQPLTLNHAAVLLDLVRYCSFSVCLQLCFLKLYCCLCQLFRLLAVFLPQAFSYNRLWTALVVDLLCHHSGKLCLEGSPKEILAMRQKRHTQKTVFLTGFVISTPLPSCLGRICLLDLTSVASLCSKHACRTSSTWWSTVISLNGYFYSFDGRLKMRVAIILLLTYYCDICRLAYLLLVRCHVDSCGVFSANDSACENTYFVCTSHYYFLVEGY